MLGLFLLYALNEFAGEYYGGLWLDLVVLMRAHGGDSRPL